ncbi:MAG: hypothetical protein JSS86_01100 [Cyanobacteria bacterium SZAS LIN-2]|nr:hypothetical protein [Cyanobacteria bacterium SZAS LIN-3]MBS1994868.1 hypothetical protein [Cyanobacteria bacterium SZAS LIN-2]
MEQPGKSLAQKLNASKGELSRFVGIFGLLWTVTFGIPVICALHYRPGYDVKVSGNPPTITFFKPAAFQSGANVSYLRVNEVNDKGETLKPVWEISASKDSTISAIQYGQIPEGWSERIRATALVPGHNYCLNGGFFFRVEAGGELVSDGLDGHPRTSRSRP